MQQQAPAARPGGSRHGRGVVRRAGSWAVVALVGAVVVRLVACGPSSDLTVTPDAATWPLRDLLAVDESRQDWDAEGRETLRARALDASSSDEGRDVDPAAPFEARGQDAAWPTDPLGSIARLDLGRLQSDRDARMFGVYGQGPDGAWSVACPMEPDELIDEAGQARLLPSSEASWPEGWRPSEAWESEHPEEIGGLTGLVPALTRWAERCGDAHAGELQAAAGFEVVQREAQAPYLLAYWPQRRKLYVNPALIALFSASDIGSEELRRRGQGLATSSVASCVSEMSALCDSCDTQAEANANPQCQQLFPQSTIFSDCTTLRDQVLNGFELYCIYRIYQTRPSVEACVQTSVGSSCDRQSIPVGSVSALVTAYDAYADPNLGGICRQEVASCADGTANNGNNGNNGVNNGTNNGTIPEPEPMPDLGDEPGCADDFGPCVWLNECGQPDPDEPADNKEYNNGCSLCGEKDPDASSDDSACCE